MTVQQLISLKKPKKIILFWKRGIIYEGFTDLLPNVFKSYEIEKFSKYITYKELIVHLKSWGVKMSVEELIVKQYATIVRPYIDNKGIQLLMQCGSTKATDYRKKIIKKHRGEQREMPLHDKIPTQLFLDFYGISRELIERSYLLIKGGNNATGI